MPPVAKIPIHRVLSCNIRVALIEDEGKGRGWTQRRDLCLQILHHHTPDIICLQEVLRIQASDFRKAFPTFQLLGFDGPEMDAHLDNGYYGVAKNPILFNTDRYELMTSGGYWLSDTPLIAGSKSWGSTRARHANWVRLKDRVSQKEFRIINLHLDLESVEARMHQLQMVVEECNQYGRNFVQILTGDFNTGWKHSVFESIRSAHWRDSYAALHGETDPGFTRHNFMGEKMKDEEDGKIDFIFCKGAVEPRASAIIRDHDEQIYPSDHFFLSADFELI